MPLAHRFVQVGEYHINIDQISYVKKQPQANGSPHIAVHFKGDQPPLVLEEKDAAEFLLITFHEVAVDHAAKGSVKVEADSAGEKPLFRALDTFDGKLTLNWKPVRHDPSHVSLTKRRVH